MAIFNSYVSLPEGSHLPFRCDHHFRSNFSQASRIQFRRRGHNDGISTCPQEDNATQLHMQRDRPYWASHRHPMVSYLQSKFKQWKIKKKNKANMTINNTPVNQHISWLWSWHGFTTGRRREKPCPRRARHVSQIFFNGGSHRATLHPPAPLNGWTLNGLSGHDIGHP